MIVLVMLISVLSLGFAVFLARQVLAADTGTPQMQDIASAIKEGAEAFLRRQNRTILVIGVVVAGLIFVLYAFVRPPTPHDPTTTFNMAIATTLSFVFGALCSGIAGYIGMFVSIRANLRTASAVRSSLNRALQIALRGGAVSGLFVVAMSLLGVGGLFALMRAFGVADEKIPLLIVGYGFGASLVALFAQLGGGIYTKAADVGADLVGKVEAGIPEDDPRNPAVIADLVGDNVGDCAGRGADLFESTAAENIGAMILGSGLAVSAARAGIHFSAGLVGIATSQAFVYITQYYTEYRYRPVREIAASAQTGPATTIITGMAVALECTALPTIVISFAILTSYFLGRSTGIANAGLFGTAVATMGMLATAAYILAMDTFGPITD